MIFIWFIHIAKQQTSTKQQTKLLINENKCPRLYDLDPRYIIPPFPYVSLLEGITVTFKRFPGQNLLGDHELPQSVQQTLSDEADSNVCFSM